VNARGSAALVLTVAAVARLALAAAGYAARGADAFMAGDSAQYQALANALGRDHQFALDGVPEVFRTPGYPLLIAASHVLNPSPAFAIAVQIGLAVVTVALVMCLARELAGDAVVAVRAGWWAALDPVLVFWTVKLMAETVWTMLVTALALVLVRYCSERRVALLVAAAALLAAQSYVKAAGYFLVPIVLLLVAFVPRGAPRLRASHALLAAAIAAVLVAPWHARNFLQTGFAGFSTLPDRAVYLSAGAALAASQAGEPLAAFREQRRADVLSTFRSDAAAASAMRTRGLDELRQSPLGYARVHAAGMARTLLDPGAVEYLRYFGRYPDSGGLLMRMSDRGMLSVVVDSWRERRSLIVLNGIMGLWLAALLAASAVGLRRVPRRAAIILVGVALYFVLISGGIHGSSRFRHPVAPMLAALAAGATSCANRGRSAGVRARRDWRSTLDEAQSERIV
jgi:4-amino-4-deoxy-L-arabinose transferase-like glycosyltransferase